MKNGNDPRSILVIIPTHNEEVAVGKVLQAVQEEVSCDIAVVDDASSDDTIRIARKEGVYVIPLSIHLGSWGAIQAGMRYAERKGYQTVVTLDGDGQHAPHSIHALLDHLQQSGADVVIGSYIKRGSWQRKVAWKIFQNITRLDTKDLTSGLRVYNKKAISLLASPDATLLDYQDLGVLLLLQKEGLHVTEIPCVMYPRLSGHSRIFSTWWKVFKYLMYTLILSFSRKNVIWGKNFGHKSS